jgi:hypothetical protein
MADQIAKALERNATMRRDFCFSVLTLGSFLNL